MAANSPAMTVNVTAVDEGILGILYDLYRLACTAIRADMVNGGHLQIELNVRNVRIQLHLKVVNVYYKMKDRRSRYRRWQQ